jgi:hypothetical protein
MPGIAALMYLVTLGVVDGCRARPPRVAWHQRLRFRASVALHHLLQPVARARGRRQAARFAHHDRPGRAATLPKARATGGGVVIVAEDRPREVLADATADLLRRRGFHVSTPIGWEGHDGIVRLSAALKGELVTSSHPPGWVQLRIRPRPRRRAFAITIVTGLTLAATVNSGAAMVVLVAFMADVARGWWRARRTLAVTLGASR